MSKRWSSLFPGTIGRKKLEQEQQERERVYHEVLKAHKEWQRAQLAFQSALGKDEVDVAIYTLEAAERRYQIQLKEAKKLKLNYGDHIELPCLGNQPVRRLGS
ncbi:DUF2508 family protein [Paenibacillus pinistramenti]|uniref:DUF2508 family protein n=1 Tax=Paenibacillus pinistramenti TaxID=1768003 RepID=UPI0011093D8A|nr:DUF2508 family protein [Paenibacillus pinistramenti]